MPSDSLIIVTTTVASQQQAEELARQIILHRLAACVQSEGPISSFYRWNNEIETAVEWRLVIKALARDGEKLSRFVAERHPYEVPQWIVVTADQVSPGYARWAAESTDPSEPENA